MSATNARALNTMRQRVKKHNAGFQKEIEAFREHPVSSSEDEPEGAKVLFCQHTSATGVQQQWSWSRQPSSLFGLSGHSCALSTC